ncbi:uncharacterized protein PV06_05812 [Exophiala oligosperma]|uniref:Uncharacterized protein n=1 Tax=Exophiala oligosperma TaxID=215243 RepID=A0A0D2DGV0_9EURO|nr:uncharacterized protein PV06_05812 [Exophiala oligosperma]KIW42248.1 hypothetical protein PV06_05812 [Exophiala oligosperma]
MWSSEARCSSPTGLYTIDSIPGSSDRLQIDNTEVPSFARFVVVLSFEMFGHRLECEQGAYFGIAIVGHFLANAPEALELRKLCGVCRCPSSPQRILPTLYIYEDAALV